MDFSIIAKNIQSLRKSKELTQGELANILNISHQAVSKWEREESIPEIDILIKLSEIFNVSLDYIILGKNNHSNVMEHKDIKECIQEINIDLNKETDDKINKFQNIMEDEFEKFFSEIFVENLKNNLDENSMEFTGKNIGEHIGKNLGETLGKGLAINFTNLFKDK